MESQSFLEWAKNEIKLAGLNDADADYDGMLGKAVTELVEVFSKQRHSGHSAVMVSAIFYRLTQYKPLTDLTDNPDDWQEVTDVMFDTEQRLSGKQIWQSRRSPSVFSYDGGKTWEDMETKEKGTSIKEESDGVEHSNKQEQEASEGAGASSSSGEAGDDKGLQAQSSTEPEAAESSSDSKESQRVARSERTVEKSQPADSDKPAPSGTQSGTKSKASGKKGGKA